VFKTDFLVKIFEKNKKVIDNINLIVKKGEFFCLVGDNGAGKTTLIKMLCGLILPTKGKLCRAGQRYFRVHPDGMIFRCSHELLNGEDQNFIKGNYSLYSRPRKCKQEFCYCVDEFKYLVTDRG